MASCWTKAGLCGVWLICCAQTAAQPPDHQPAPPAAEADYVFQVRLEAADGPFALDVVLDRLRLTAPTELDRPLELPAPLPAIRLTRFLPHAALEQMAVPAEGADHGPGRGPAVLLAIEGPKQSFQRWLLADDPERNRLVSLIGLWRFMAVTDSAQRDELFRQFKNELDREPMLIIRRVDADAADAGDAAVELPLRVGETQSVGDLGCSVRVLEFLADGMLDPATKRPINETGGQPTPAARVEIEKDGQREVRWVHPGPLIHDREGVPPENKQKLALPQFELSLDCPPVRAASTPDFVLVSVSAAPPELFARTAEAVTARAVAPDERIEIPGSRYTFRIAQFLASARLHEEYHPSDAHGTPPALRIEVAVASGTGAGGTTPLWLELGKRRLVSTPRGPMAVSFKLAGAADRGAHP